MRRRQRTAERFLLAWLVPTWLLFELLPTKLPHYVLPTFPALALLVGRAALTAPSRLRPPAKHLVTRLLAGGWSLLTVAIGIAVLAAALWLGDLTARIAGLACFLVAATVALACLRRIRSGQIARAASVALFGAPIVYALLFVGVLPNLDALWPSRGVAAMIDRAASQRPLASAGYHEVSLGLITGGEIALLDGTGAATFLAAHPDALVLVGDNERPAFIDTARHLGLALRSRASMRAIDYSHGRWIDLDLLERDSGGEPSGAR
jgi:4-amino-4-deoxy-L-arabinose transferase-like glycosyltransferase